MQNSLHKSVTDQATKTFLRRCDELGLWVWACSDDALEGLVPQRDEPLKQQTRDPQVDEVDHAVRDALAGLKQDGSPGRLHCGHTAVWLKEKDGPVDGFVLVDPEPNLPDGVDRLTAIARPLRWCLDDLRRIDQNQFAVDDLAEQLGQSYENITMLYSIGQSMSSLQAPQHMAQGICEQLRVTQGYGWSAARFKSDADDVSGFHDACLIAGKTPCDTRAFREATGRLLAEWDDASWTKLLQVGEHRLADLVGSEVILDPIRHDGQVIGVVLSGGKTGPDAEATSGDTQLLDAIAGFLGAFL